MPFSFPSNPTVGQYSRQNNRVYKWNGYSWDLFYNTLTVSVLVVGGGGAGGSGGSTTSIGGGGGGGDIIEQTVPVSLGVGIPVTVGAGGAGSVTQYVKSSNGIASRFDNVIAIGGGAGGIGDANGSSAAYVRPGRDGGNGGGKNATTQNAGETLGISLTGRGFSGGGGDGFRAGGGGGAGQAGSNAGVGGNGKVAVLTGLTYSGGGGGGRGQFGGTGGGGRGGDSGINAVAGTANTGGGGGGAFTGSVATGTGGSGVVVLRFDATLTITLSAGLTYSVAFVDNEEIVTITQGTGTVTFTA
jgi:hypothetical protein